MWPKAIAQLIELLPHMSRLLPLADRFLNSKTADAEASRTAMEQMAAGLRGDLGQVTASHAGLYRQLNEQSEKLGTIYAEITATRSEIAALQAQQDLLKKQLSLTLIVGIIMVSMLCVVIGFGIVILTHVHNIH